MDVKRIRIKNKDLCWIRRKFEESIREIKRLKHIKGKNERDRDKGIIVIKNIKKKQRYMANYMSFWVHSYQLLLKKTYSYFMYFENMSNKNKNISVLNII